MLIGDRIRAIRESKDLTQGDIEKRCGLFRFYISRVENGHTVPSVGTLAEAEGLEGNSPKRDAAWATRAIAAALGGADRRNGASLLAEIA